MKTEEREIEILENLYEKLRNECLRQKRKILSSSILLTLIKASTNNRYRILNDVSISSAVIPIDLVNSLIKKNYIQFTDEGTHITLSGYGIWYYENIKNKNTLDNFIKGVEQEYFENLFSKVKPIGPNEKCLILALLAARAFSANSAVNLKKSNRINESWKTIIDLVYNFLVEHSIIENKNIYPKVGNEHPVEAVFRRANYLTANTRKIFSNQGESTYFLDLYKNGKIDISELTFLFKKVFEDKLNKQLMDEVFLFCCSISKERSLEVFDRLEKHIFATHDYGELIKESLINLVFKS